jgi:hypothetical protein
MKFNIILLLLAGMLLSSHSVAGKWERVPKVPLVTKRCVVHGELSCSEYEYTSSVRSASCTENCLVRSSLNSCQLRNRCILDEPSGCFRKMACSRISNLYTCRMWEERAICP